MGFHGVVEVGENGLSVEDAGDEGFDLAVEGVMGVLAQPEKPYELYGLRMGSRGKFVFLDDVLRGRSAIGEPWGRCGRLGDSLFWWSRSSTPVTPDREVT